MNDQLESNSITYFGIQTQFPSGKSRASQQIIIYNILKSILKQENAIIESTSENLPSLSALCAVLSYKNYVLKNNDKEFNKKLIFGNSYECTSSKKQFLIYYISTSRFILEKNCKDLNCLQYNQKATMLCSENDLNEFKTNITGKDSMLFFCTYDFIFNQLFALKKDLLFCNSVIIFDEIQNINDICQKIPIFNITFTEIEFIKKAIEENIDTNLIRFRKILDKIILFIKEKCSPQQHNGNEVNIDLRAMFESCEINSETWPIISNALHITIYLIESKTLQSSESIASCLNKFYLLLYLIFSEQCICFDSKYDIDKGQLFIFSNKPSAIFSFIKNACHCTILLGDQIQSFDSFENDFNMKFEIKISTNTLAKSNEKKNTSIDIKSSINKVISKNPIYMSLLDNKRLISIKNNTNIKYQQATVNSNLQLKSTNLNPRLAFINSTNQQALSDHHQDSINLNNQQALSDHHQDSINSNNQQAFSDHHQESINLNNQQALSDHHQDSINSNNQNAKSDSNSVNSFFFSKENLSSLECSTGKEIVGMIKRKAFAEGFSLYSTQSRSASFMSLKCSNKNCNFFINIQAHNYTQADQYYCITDSMNLIHNHKLSPISFVHKTVDKTTKNLINGMSKVHIDNTKIAEYLNREKNIQITTQQVSYLVDKNKDKKVPETDELIQKMINEKGMYKLYPPDEDNKINYRKAIATFTVNELNNLKNYGDMICLDPTYPSLTSNWTTIPISLVGSSRELLSGGVVFCSNVTADLYEWIIKTLIYDLPCASILKTICSDDDLILDSAWNQIIRDPKCCHIQRIICIWHKYNQFKDLVKKSGLSAKDQCEILEKFIELFSTRNCTKCEDLVKEIKSKHPSFCNFIVTSIENRLNTSTKAFTKNVLSLGYLANVFSECNNSNIKKLLGSNASSLSEMREVITRSEERRKLNREFIKSRKSYKAIDVQLTSIMSMFHVQKVIAESIVGSKNKADKLSFEKNGNIWKVTENQTNDIYLVKNEGVWQCSCGKVTSVGLPCSHIIKILKELNEFEKIKELIHKRWIQSEQSTNIEIIKHSDEQFQIFSKVTNVNIPCKKRYLNMMAKSQSVASIACKNKKAYNEYMKMLEDAQNKFLGIYNHRDAKAVKCGRPRKSRIKPKEIKKRKKCQICGENHDTKKCKDLVSVRKLIDFEPNKKKSKMHCVICSGAGHFAKTCPALQKWKKIKRNEEEEEEEEYN